MNTNKKAVFTAATLMLMALVPLTTAIPDGSPDATVAGPASFVWKGILGVGVGFCQSQVSGIPFDCNNPPGTIGAAGAYAHDISLTSTADPGACGALSGGRGGCYYNVWAIQTGGTEITGWGITVCTNRDSGQPSDNGACSNVGPLDIYDDFSNGYKGDELAGWSKEHKKCKKEYGEDPGPTDPCHDWAHVYFCAREDVITNELGVFQGWNGWDEIWVFITDWVDEGQIDADWSNLGSGLSVGLYDIYVEGGQILGEQDCKANIKNPNVFPPKL